MTQVCVWVTGAGVVALDVRVSCRSPVQLTVTSSVDGQGEGLVREGAPRVGRPDGEGIAAASLRRTREGAARGEAHAAGKRPGAQGPGVAGHTAVGRQPDLIGLAGRGGLDAGRADRDGTWGGDRDGEELRVGLTDGVGRLQRERVGALNSRGPDETRRSLTLHVRA